MTEQQQGTGKPAGGGGNVLGKVPPRGWLVLLLVVAAAVFLIQNRESARVHFLFVTVDAPMWCALAVATGVGLIIGLLAARRGRRKA